jgi:M6 family metalloprotease-like protein
LNVVWGDPHPELGNGGETRFTLVMPDGRIVPLEMAGQDSAAVLHFGRRVTISGRVVPYRAPAVAGGGMEAIRVDTIARSAERGDQNTSAAVVGTRRVIYLLLRFSDDAAVPHPPAFFTALTNPDTPPGGAEFPATINGFFKRTSWNQFSWLGDVGGVGGVGAPGGWLTLPHPKSHYAPCGWSSSCVDLDAIGVDGTALGRAQGITFTNYDNINFVLSNDLDCCAWGGSFFSVVDGKSYGATWEPPWGQETGVYVHEMGHSLGLPHSGWVYYAYDSPWDMMSSTLSADSVECGSYQSANSGETAAIYCTEPGDGYIAPHKDYLGWIPAANLKVADSIAPITLEAGALALGSAMKMIKICIPGFPCTPGPEARYFTVEARVKALGSASQYDNAIPGEGVIVHSVDFGRPAPGGTCFFNLQLGWAEPVDSTPGDYDSVACNAGGRVYPNYALFNARWDTGSTYTNGSHGFNVRVISRTGSNFVVSVVTFTDQTLTAGSSLIRAVHITELRIGINAVRAARGLGEFAFADAAVTPGSTMVRALHILELRHALGEVYAAAKLPAPAYTDPGLTATAPIRGVHVQELRTALLASP